MSTENFDVVPDFAVAVEDSVSASFFQLRNWQELDKSIFKLWHKIGIPLFTLLK